MVAEREGGPPDHVAVCHPANWGPYKLELLTQACRIAELSGVTTVSEPEAAAIHYAAQERTDPGEHLFKRERLDQIVVGASVEAMHPIFQ